MSRRDRRHAAPRPVSVSAPSPWLPGGLRVPSAEELDAATRPLPMEGFAFDVKFETLHPRVLLAGQGRVFVAPDGEVLYSPIDGVVYRAEQRIVAGVWHVIRFVPRGRVFTVEVKPDA